MINDPISDMLTRIRNASLAKHHYVSINHTKTTLVLSKILKKQGFIHHFSLKEKRCVKSAREKSALKQPTQTEIQLKLKYLGRFQRPCIHNLQRLSSSSLRTYSTYKQLPRVFNGMGLVILTTSHGIMTDREARRKKLGGEVICSIW